MRSRSQGYLALGLGVLWFFTALWGLGNLNARRRAETLLQNKYNRAFYECLQRTKNVEVLLSKGLVSGSPEQMDVLFSDLWYNANSAQENLNQLPVSHDVLARTSKFLTQVGDYAFSLAKKNRGRVLAPEDWEKMEQLYEKAGVLTRELSLIERDVSQGRFRWTEVKQNLARQLPRGFLASADRSFRRLDTQLEELPVLIYDGPFSEHIEQAKPRGLTGPEVTAGEAKKIARAFADLAGARLRGVRLAGTIQGKIPAYSVELRVGERPWDIISVDVSRKGGHVVYLINPRQVKEARMSDEEARKRAVAFLASRGLRDFVPTYTLREQNVLTVSFAFRQGEVVVYPDQVKVQVALDNGQVVGFEALGYLTSHHIRALPEARLSPAEARQRLSPRLEVLAERLALVPTAGKQEVLTYEFKTRLGRDTFLVYVNALTGEEEHIFKLLQNPNGTLVL